MELRRVGERGLLVCLDGNASAQRLARHARDRLGHELQEIVPGHETVLLVGRDARPDAAGLDGWERDPDPDGDTREALEIAVTYDGEDVDDVAAECGCSSEELVRRHLDARYTVAFLGFAPGFAYLIGGDERLRAARLDSPRERVPAGAVALAGEYCAVYPRASPGGWRLIGHTALTMFDARRDPPALATPGREVRFVPAAP